MVPLGVGVETPVWLEQGTLGRMFVRDALPAGAPGGAARDAITLVEPEGRKLWTSPVWPVSAGARLTAAPQPMPDGGVVLCTSEGVARLDFEGKHHWKVEAPPCVAALRGRLTPLVVLTGGEVRALDHDGAASWRFPAPRATGLAVLADASVAVVEPGSIRALDGYGRVAWEVAEPELAGPVVATTDGAVALMAAPVPDPPGRVLRLKPPGPARLRVAADGRPALMLPEGLIGLEASGELEVVGPAGEPRWRAPCLRAAVVVFGEIACAAGTHARAYRADGTLMAEAALPGGAVVGALATQEWIFGLTRGPDGSHVLRGVGRVPLPAEGRP